MDTLHVPVVTLFNNKGGVGKTSLVYHLAWMLSDMGERVLACDFDPQANLTAAFLSEDRLETIWNPENYSLTTIYRCVRPLTQIGDIEFPELASINPNLRLIPGDLGLSWFEDSLSMEWPRAIGADERFRPFRILTSFSIVAQQAAHDMDASIILVDVGPNLGAINRSVLICTDFIVVPLGADIFSLQALRNLGPTLNKWRESWARRRKDWDPPEFPLPLGQVKPIGYVVQQHSVRLKRPIKANDKWFNRIPKEYASALGGQCVGPFPSTPLEDENCLSTIRHYRSLVSMSQEARKPIFRLTNADGAFGGHAAAVRDALDCFQSLAESILNRVNIKT